MSDDAFAKIVADMPEVETLALLSVRDSGPISDALRSSPQTTPCAGYVALAFAHCKSNAFPAREP